MAIKWRSKIILAKIETVYGTDPTPTGAANAILATDIEMRPMEGQDVSRNLDVPFLGAQEEFPAGLHTVISFSVELVGSGEAGTAPAWGPLIRGCAAAETIVAETSVEYNPVSESHESVTLYFQIGPSLHKIKGARGTAVITVNAQGIPVCRFTFTGMFTTPADTAAPTPDYTDFQKPKIASSTNTPVFTINGNTFVLRNYSLDLGCDVQPRLLIGSESIQIVDKAERLSATVEAVALATYNPYSAANGGGGVPVVLQQDTSAGRKVTISVPLGVQKRLSGFENQQGILEWPLQFTPRFDEGDDQWSILLD